MAKPVFTQKAVRPVGIVELSDKLILGYLYFDKGTLAPTKFCNLTQYSPLNRSEAWKNFHTLVAYHGSQFATTNWIPCRTLCDTNVMNPNLDINIVQVIPGNDSDLVLFDKSGTGYRIVSKDDTSFINAPFGSNGTYISLGCAIAINENEWVDAFTYSYGDRAYLFRRFSWKNDTLTRIHDRTVEYTNGHSGLLMKNGSYVYGYMSRHYREFSVHVYNISNKRSTVLLQESPGSGYQTHVPSQFHPTASTDTTKVFYYAYIAGTNQLGVKKVTLDLTANKVTSEDCTISFGSSSFKFNGSSDSRIQVRTWISYANDTYYLNVLLTSRDDYSMPNEQYVLYTFKIDPTNPNNLTYVTEAAFKSHVVSLIFLDKERTRLMVYGVNDAYSVVFNGSSWTILPLSVGRIITSVYDNYGRLWMISEQGEFYLFLPQIPASVEIRFEKDTYDYTGTTITTNIYVSAYNFQGARISVNGTLKLLTDNAEFNDGSREKEVTTSTTGDVQVPIKITGPGLVEAVFDVNFTVGG